MKAGKFFPVPYMGHLAPDIQELRDCQGGLIAYARWHVLLGFMYEYNGVIKLTDTRVKILAGNMEMDVDSFLGFLDSCADIGLISRGMLDRGEVISEGVVDQLDFKARKAEAGKRGGKSAKQGDKAGA